MDGETVQLKQQLNAEREKIKRLQTQMQRLASISKVSHSELKSDALIIELEDKIGQLGRNNLNLKSKLAHTEALLAARASKQRSTSFSVPKRPLKKPAAPIGSEQRPVAVVNLLEAQEVSRLQELVNMLRKKLVEVEANKQELVRKLEEERRERRGEIESILSKSDLDAIRLQKSLHDLQRDLTQIRSRSKESERENSDLRMRLSALQAENDEIRAIHGGKINSPNNIPQDRLDNLDLIVQDLKEENKSLAAENTRLIALTTNTASSHSKHSEKESEENYQLRKMIEDLQNQTGVYRRQIEELSQERKCGGIDEANYLELKNCLEKNEELQQRLAIIDGNEAATMQQIQEAINLIHLRKLNGFTETLDFLSNFDDQIEVARRLDIERKRHVETIEDLRKTRELLKLQEKLHQSLREETEILKKKLLQLENDTGIKIDDQYRIIELKDARIARLEARLQDLLQTGIVYHHNQTLAEGQAHEKLLLGENLIEISVFSAKFGDEQSASDGHLATFVSCDFFDFAPQITNIALGSSPIYQFSARFKIETDEIFVDYMLNRSLVFEIWQNVCGELIKLGSSKMRLEDVFNCCSNDSVPLKYSTEISDSYGRPKGYLSWGFRSQIALRKTISEFQEKKLSRDLVRRSDSSQKNDFNLPINRLFIRFDKITLEKPFYDDFSKFHLGFSYYMLGSYVTDSFEALNHSSNCHDSINREFILDVELQIDVFLSLDFDNFLKTQPMEVILFTESDKTKPVSFAVPDLDSRMNPSGSVLINLQHLTKSGNIKGVWDILSDEGTRLAILCGSLYFEAPYRLTRPEISSGLSAKGIKSQIFNRNCTISEGVSDIGNNKDKSNNPLDSIKTKEDICAAGPDMPLDSSNSLSANAIAKEQDSGQIMNEDCPAMPAASIDSSMNASKKLDQAVSINGDTASNINPAGFDSYSNENNKAFNAQPEIAVFSDGEADRSIIKSIELDDNFSKAAASTGKNLSVEADKIILEAEKIISETGMTISADCLPKTKQENLTEGSSGHSSGLELQNQQEISAAYQISALSEDQESIIRFNAVEVQKNNLHKTDEQYLPECKLKICVNSIDFSAASDNVKSYFLEALGIEQFFVSYSFLSNAPEELESPSFKFSPDTPVLIAFEKDFDFRSLENGKDLVNFFQNSSSSIVFTIVSEPPIEFPGSGMSHCIDFAIATLDLRNVLEIFPGNDTTNASLDVYINRQDPIASRPFDVNTINQPIGNLNLKLSGMDFLREVIDLSSSPAKQAKSTKISKSEAAIETAPYDSNNRKQVSLSAYSLPSKATLPISNSFAKLLPARRSQSLANTSNSSLADKGRKPRKNSDEIASIDDLAERLFDG